MKKAKMFFIGLLASIFSISNVSATTVNSLDDLKDNFISGNNKKVIGYKISDKFVCYSCGAFCINATTNQYTCMGGPESNEQYGTTGIASGIGIYYKDGETWKTGSFPGPASAAGFPNQRYPLSSLFVAAAVGNNPDAQTSTGATGIINDYILESNNGTLSKTINDAKITVTPETYTDKNFIKLVYNVKNGNTAQTINISTFNDVYIGGEYSSNCDDNAAYELNTHIKNITNGFNAKTGTTDNKKYMTIVLEENSGLLSNGGGKFNYWAGVHNTVSTKNATTNVISSLFKTTNSGIPSSATPYSDSEFSYTWSKQMDANEETTFSTLIGLGNLGDVDVTIDSLGPNYNSDDKQFKLTTDDKNINIEGTINDKCGMGTYSYKINGVCVDDPEKTEGCKEYTYYTDNTFKTNYNVEIPTKLLSDSEEGNNFEITAKSVACGTDTEKTTFTLAKDKTDVPKTGINSNYIVLTLILIGGIGVFVYSRKHNKFPQV